MAVDAVGGSRTGDLASASGFSSLSSEDFTKIIFTELSKQDPLQPNDTNALIQQISTIRGIQSDIDLTSSLKKLVDQNEFASASTLIGKMISGVDEANSRVTGSVRTISRTEAGAVATLLTGERVPVSRIDQIRETPGGGQN